MKHDIMTFKMVLSMFKVHMKGIVDGRCLCLCVSRAVTNIIQSYIGFPVPRKPFSE